MAFEKLSWQTVNANDNAFPSRVREAVAQIQLHMDEFEDAIREAQSADKGKKWVFAYSSTRGVGIAQAVDKNPKTNGVYFK